MKKISIATAMLGALLVANLFGQSEGGTVVGAVTDPAGAVVPGATITVTNDASGTARTVTSNASGQYRVDAFPIGPLTITAERTGFQKLVRSGAALTVGDVLTVNLVLNVGNVQETVEVTTAPPQLETQTAAVSTLIQNVQVTETPLNGRDFTQLNLLSSGASPTTPSGVVTSLVGFSRGSDSISYNGNTANNNAYLVDGIYDMQLWNFALVMIPTIDSIEEQRLLANAYSAQYGGAAGAVTLVQTKSGGDKFHGDLYEFLKNGLMDANSYFNEVANPPIAKPIEKRNEYGGTFGGPIHKNKTFFFVDYEGINWVQPLQETESIITQAQRNEVATGIFGTTPIYDPLTCNSTGVGCTTFPKNSAANYYIPNYAARVSQQALNLISIVPLPQNSASSNNYVWNPVSTQVVHQGDGRIDQNIGKADRFFAKYSADYQTAAGACSVPPNAATAAQFDINPACLNAASPSPYSNLQKNWSITGNYTKVVSPTFIDEIRVGGVRNYLNLNSASFGRDNADALGIPGLSVQLYNEGLPGISIGGINTTVGSGNPEYLHDVVFQYEDVATWNRGTHSIKFGASFFRDRFDGHDNQNSTGSFTFNGIFTNNGKSSNSTALTDFALGLPEAITRAEQFGEFGQRNWKFAPFIEDSWRATNQLTLNYGFRYELESPWVEVRARNNSETNMTAQGQVLFPNNNPCGLSTICLQKTAWAPRAGIAYSLTKDGKTVFRAGSGFANFWATNGGELLDENAPMNIIQQFTQTGVSASTIYTLSTGIPAVVEPDLLNPAALTPIWFAQDPHTRQAQNIQWNADIQRQLRNDMALSIGYVGTRTNYMMNPIDPNQAALQLPGGTLSLAQRRPLYYINPAIQDINYRANSFGAKYESLQVNLDKRYAFGLTGHVAFTYSHNESSTVSASSSTNPIMNSYCIKCEWGNVTEDRRLMLIINHVYELPFGPGRKFVNHGIASYIVGGWGLTGLWTLYSGEHFTPADSASNVSGVAYNGSFSERPNLVPGCNISAPPGGRSNAEWFNINCFTVAAANTFGNSRPGLVVGPGDFTVDTQLNRNFPIHENMHLQLRWEAFNATNHVNFSTFGTSIGSSSAGVMSAAYPNRVMQVALKLIF